MIKVSNNKKNQTFRIVVWGLGQHAIKNILPAISILKELSLYGVCSRSTLVAKDCAEKWNCHSWTDADQMLADPLVDIVYLATPIGLHAEQGMQILSAGKHFWCEKPLTCNLSDTNKILQVAKDRMLTVTEGFMYLDHSHFNRVYNFIHKKEKGDIKSIICRFGIPPLNNPGFRKTKELGGGAFWDVGSYTVSALLALFPNQPVEILYCEKLNESNSIVDNEGRALLRFSGKITAYLEWSVDYGYRNEIDIWAQKGSLFTDKIFSKSLSYRPYLRLRNLEGVESCEYLEQGENHFVKMFCRFYDTLENPKLAMKEAGNILRRAEVLHMLQSGNR